MGSTGKKRIHHDPASFHYAATGGHEGKKDSPRMHTNVEANETRIYKLGVRGSELWNRFAGLLYSASPVSSFAFTESTEIHREKRF